MKPATRLNSINNERKSAESIENYETLISHEAYLRKEAYKNTTIKTDNSFYDDSDMLSEYFLVILYDKNSNVPLLSSRYYFDKAAIAKFLKGENKNGIDLNYLGQKFNLDNFKTGEIFLADRLSGNIKSTIYRQYRNRIFSLYYSEIVTHNPNCSLLLMVRKENKDKQLLKYLKLGFVLIGSTMHKSKEHSIIIGDLKKAHSYVKSV
jgi:hypothetical protein